MEYVIVGAGTIGSLVAHRLADSGHHVTLLSRRGVGPVRAGVTLVAGDVAAEGHVASLATGAAAIFNCANPAYHRWPTDWPPIANAVLDAAERSDATLVTLGNLYPYGAVSGPMSPDTPFGAQYEKAQIRARMWFDAIEAHGAGRLNAVEVRASDFIGPRAQGVFGQLVVPRLLRGATCRVIGSLDQPHSWSFVDDVARTLVACAQTPTTWGRAWHVPTNPPRTQRQVLDDLAEVAGVARVKASVIPLTVMRLAGLFNPTVRELPTTLYQFTQPFVIDDTRTRRELSLEPTAWPDVLRATVDAFRPAASKRQ